MKVVPRVYSLTLFFCLCVPHSYVHSEYEEAIIGTAAAACIALAGWALSSPSDKQIIKDTRELCKKIKLEQDILEQDYGVLTNSSPAQLNPYLAAHRMTIEADLKKSKKHLKELEKQHDLVRTRMEKLDAHKPKQAATLVDYDDAEQDLHKQVEHTKARVEHLTYLQKFDEERRLCATAINNINKAAKESQKGQTVDTSKASARKLKKESARCTKTLSLLSSTKLPEKPVNPCIKKCAEETAALTKTLQEQNNWYHVRSAMKTIDGYIKQYNEVVLASDPLEEVHNWAQGKEKNEPFLFFCEKAHDIIVDSQKIYDELLKLKESVPTAFKPQLEKDIETVHEFMRGLMRVRSTVTQSEAYGKEKKREIELLRDQRLSDAERKLTECRNATDRNTSKTREHETQIRRLMNNAERQRATDQQMRAENMELRRTVSRLLREVESLKRQAGPSYRCGQDLESQTPPSYKEATEDPLSKPLHQAKAS